LGEHFATDVVGNAAALDVFKFLKLQVDGQRLLDWVQVQDEDLAQALHDDPATAKALLSAFGGLVRLGGQPASHDLAKQVYWLAGNDAADDSQFHLLQPMFSSSLAHSLPQRQLRNAETQRRRGHHRSLPHRQLRKPRQKTSLCQLLTPASSWHQRAFSPSPNDGLSPQWIAPKEKCLLQTGPLP